METNYDWIGGEQEKYFMDFLPMEIKREYAWNPRLLVFGMTADSTAVGAAAVNVIGAEAVLEYVYVAPDYRKNGMCSECLTELCYALWQLGVNVLRANYIPEEQEEFHTIMELHQAHIVPTGGGALRFMLRDVKNNPNFAGSTAGVRALAECSNAQLSLLYRKIRRKGADLVELPFDLSDYDLSCSGVYFKNGAAEAVLLVQKTEDGLYLPFVFSDTGSPVVPMLLMRFAVQQGSGKFPEDMACGLRAMDGPMTRLLEKLTGQRITEEVQASIPFDYLDETYRKFVERLMYLPIDQSETEEE